MPDEHGRRRGFMGINEEKEATHKSRMREDGGRTVKNVHVLISCTFRMQV